MSSELERGVVRLRRSQGDAQCGYLRPSVVQMPGGLILSAWCSAPAAYEVVVLNEAADASGRSYVCEEHGQRLFTQGALLQGTEDLGG